MFFYTINELWIAQTWLIGMDIIKHSFSGNEHIESANASSNEECYDTTTRRLYLSNQKEIKAKGRFKVTFNFLSIIQTLDTFRFRHLECLAFHLPKIWISSLKTWGKSSSCTHPLLQSLGNSTHTNFTLGYSTFFIGGELLKENELNFHLNFGELNKF